jgi:hypothetical protein
VEAKLMIWILDSDGTPAIFDEVLWFYSVPPGKCHYRTSIRHASFFPDIFFNSLSHPSIWHSGPNSQGVVKCKKKESNVYRHDCSRSRLDLFRRRCSLYTFDATTPSSDDDADSSSVWGYFPRGCRSESLGI